MGTRIDPQSNTWTAEALSTNLFTPSRPIKCKCKDDFTVVIPESLLCYFSRYYNALLRGTFSEAGSDTITLELTEQQAKAFVTWMYSGQIDESLYYADLFELYVFADKVDVPAMKKDIMTFIHKHSHDRGSPDLGDAARVFSLLPESCGLVRWILDRFACHEDFTPDTDFEFGMSIMAAGGKRHVFRCFNTGMEIPADPCCNVIEQLGCDCSYRCREKVKKGQACAYHEHESVEEWRGKFPALQIDPNFADMMESLCWR